MKPYDKYKDAKGKYRTTLILVYHKDQYIAYDEDAQIIQHLCNLPPPKNKTKHKIKIPYDNISTVLKTLIQNSDIHSDKDLGYTRVGLIQPPNIELWRTKNLKHQHPNNPKAYT